MEDMTKTAPTASEPGQSFWLAALTLLGLTVTAGSAAAQECARDNGGLTLPAGFCAVVVAEGLPGPRHMTVAPNGDLFVALAGSRTAPGRGVLALRDTNGDGLPDQRASFGDVGAH